MASINLPWPPRQVKQARPDCVAGTTLARPSAHVLKRSLLMEQRPTDRTCVALAGRAADPSNTYGPKGFVMASFGARYNFQWGEQQGQLRLLTSNLFGGRPFIAGPSGLFNQFGPGTWRATLRLTY